MRDLHSNDVETAARLALLEDEEQHGRQPAWSQTPTVPSMDPFEEPDEPREKGSSS